MAVYQDIIEWSKGKPSFMRDAIRRLLISPTLTDPDIDTIKELVKKECGFEGITIDAIPASETDIPITNNTAEYVRLKEIASPHNIAALYEGTPLKFEPTGLTAVFGRNGSGKSSYSKILKKFCWSRDKSVVLKKNVYVPTTDPQSVVIKYVKGDAESQYEWQEGNENVSEDLNSVYVFDSKCANIYLNNDNAAEYKPVGLDVLEKLVSLLTKLGDAFSADILQFQKTKYQLADKYRETGINKWYQDLEEKSRSEIEGCLVLSEEQKRRKETLEQALRNNNLAETNKTLSQKVARYQCLHTKLSEIEDLFSDESIKELRGALSHLRECEQANLLARKSFETDTPFSIGGDAWKLLWAAAKEYATKELDNHFPVSTKEGVDYCVLCHQPLSPNAKERLERFDLFIQDKTSLAVAKAKKELESLVKLYEAVNKNFISEDLKAEIIDGKEDIEAQINEYIEDIIDIRGAVLRFVKNEVQELEKIEFQHLSVYVGQEIVQINAQIQTNSEALTNREQMMKEYLELEALSELVHMRADVLAYYDECVLKKKYQQCKAAVTPRAISIKIGEIQDSQAIAAQHALFVHYLQMLNPKIAHKVALKKTRTSSGVTYQKCKFDSIGENITDVFSEGEQKIVAIANFLSECTIEGAKNSIIFDDPINSLDLEYREAVARIIVELSRDRQVIVMTHDLYFLRLLMDIHKNICSSDCFVTCINSDDTHSGIVSDEIPYLAKNVQERINTITAQLDEIQHIEASQIGVKRYMLNDVKCKMRQLIEKTAEDILVGRTISRFSKNVDFKRGNLASIIVTEKKDADFLLGLYGKYSTVIHDGSIETEPNEITERDVKQDIYDFRTWKDEFVNRVKEWKRLNGYVNRE